MGTGIGGKVEAVQVDRCARVAGAGRRPDGLWRWFEPDVLSSPGLGEKLKVVGVAADASIIHRIPDKFAAFTQAPHGWMSRAMIGAAARLSVGDKISEKYEDQIYTDPLWVINSKESAEALKSVGYEWPGPAGFEESFEKLRRLK